MGWCSHLVETARCNAVYTHGKPSLYHCEQWRTRSMPWAKQAVIFATIFLKRRHWIEMTTLSVVTAVYNLRNHKNHKSKKWDIRKRQIGTNVMAHGSKNLGVTDAVKKKKVGDTKTTSMFNFNPCCSCMQSASFRKTSIIFFGVRLRIMPVSRTRVISYSVSVGCQKVVPFLNDCIPWFLLHNSQERDMTCRR